MWLTRSPTLPEMDPVGRRMLALGKWADVKNTTANAFGPRRGMLYHYHPIPICAG